MDSAQAPLAEDVQLLVLGVPREVDMVGTPARVKSVADPLLVVVVVEQPLPLHEPKLGAVTVHPPEPETSQLLLAVWVLVAVEV